MYEKEEFSNMNLQTNVSCRNTSLTSCPCDYRATWILGCEERLRDQSGGAGPGGGNSGDDGDDGGGGTLTVDDCQEHVRDQPGGAWPCGGNHGDGGGTLLAVLIVKYRISTHTCPAMPGGGNSGDVGDGGGGGTLSVVDCQA